MFVIFIYFCNISAVSQHHSLALNRKSTRTFENVIFFMKINKGGNSCWEFLSLKAEENNCFPSSVWKKNLCTQSEKLENGKTTILYWWATHAHLWRLRHFTMRIVTTIVTPCTVCEFSTFCLLVNSAYYWDNLIVSLQKSFIINNLLLRF